MNKVLNLQQQQVHYKIYKWHNQLNLVMKMTLKQMNQNQKNKEKEKSLEKN